MKKTSTRVGVIREAYKSEEKIHWAILKVAAALSVMAAILIFLIKNR